MMATWIRHNLGPTIRNSSFANIKIITLDDQGFFLPWFVLKHKITRNYIEGIAVHWYYDKVFPASLLKQTHDNFPEKFLLTTEACRGEKATEKDDVNNWVGGWVDWNMALNMKGGPTYINNYVDSPIIVNSAAGEFYKQPTFYNLRHFTKFVPKDSVQIRTSSFDKHVLVTTFQRSHNGTVVVILNKKDQVIPVSLVDESRGSTQINLSKKSITTVVYW